MKKIAGLVILLSAFAAGSVVADNPREIKGDKKEIRQDTKEILQSKQCLGELSSLMDSWTDAHLSGESRRARRLEQAIYNLLVRDINASSWAVWLAEREVRDSKIEVVAGQPPNASRADDRADLRDDHRDCVRSRKMLEAKEHLLSRLRDKQSFSYKHQLLSDYQELLRRELGQAKTEWVEDVREIREDKNR